MATRRIHLQPVGGIAGDMFAAALLDAFPGALDPVLAAVRRVVPEETAEITLAGGASHGITGRRFRVHEHAAPGNGHRHVHWAALRRRIREAGLAPGVAERALDIFGLLAEAEARVHGVAPEEVAFHEVGAVDSLVDVVAAAALIETVAAAEWTCEPLPLGRGTVETAHGRLPLPAPAVAELIRGLPVTDDGVAGERVTPTGAAIVRHLDPGFDSPAAGGRLAHTGTGLGSRSLPGVPNLLRVLVVEAEGAPGGLQPGLVGVVEFEVDDQTPEDLAVGLERLRAHAGVLDVLQYPVTGKKGRLAVAVRLLTEPGAVERVAAACLQETRTLGLRCGTVRRLAVPRRTVEVDGPGGPVPVKIADRPGGATAKAEMDHVRHVAGTRPRDDARRRAERLALDKAEDGE